MGWPYSFITLSAEERQLRRETQDRYAAYAQLSAAAPVVLVLLYRLAVYSCRKFRIMAGADAEYDAIPDSPGLKVMRQRARGAWGTRLRQIRWWSGDDVVFLGQHWGQRDQWVGGLAWGAWMLALTLSGTGDDYLHLTKRFGIIACSQFPIQYLLALKTLNPVAYAFRSSHEQINRWHRVLGRVIYVLLIAHGTLYLNYYIQNGILAQKLVERRPFIGLLSFAGLSALAGTAAQAVRRYSYRVFFVTHLMVALLVPLVLVFHAQPTNVFVAEALLVFIADLVSRRIGTVTSDASLAMIPGTSLIRVTAPLPRAKADRFRDAPASHVYVSLPPAGRPAADAQIFNYLYNPFTVAAVDEESGALTLIARRRGGPMTATLAGFTKAPASTVPLAIEGPYGLTRHFPAFSHREFDRVLLVAGGVGASFVMPLYHAIVHDASRPKVELVWAVRAAADATWAVPSAAGKTILDDDDVHIFLTGDMATAVAYEDGVLAADGAVELDTLAGSSGRRERLTAANSHRRPNLRKIVDDVFRHESEERVAVLVCGPDGMARELRALVGAWVMKGRSVWWHNEGFGW